MTQLTKYLYHHFLVLRSWALYPLPTWVEIDFGLIDAPSDDALDPNAHILITKRHLQIQGSGMISMFYPHPTLAANRVVLFHGKKHFQIVPEVLEMKKICKTTCPKL